MSTPNPYNVQMQRQSPTHQETPSASPSGSSRAGHAHPHHPAPSRIRRRNRLITSCLECRRRKLKCDKQHPCSNCTRFSRDCVFLAPALDAASQLKLAEIKEKMGSLERTLEEDIARRTTGRSRSSSRLGAHLPGLGDGSSEEDLSDPEDERGLEPTPLATVDAAYDDNADDNFVDLGVQFGRMRITERIGGFVRPKLAQEVAEAITEVPDLQGPMQPHPLAPQVHPSSYLVPGPDYLAPSASFFFAPSVRKSNLLQSLPAKSMADTLLKRYWVAVHPIAPTVHRQSFERQYASFWKDIATGIEPRASLQSLVLAAMLSAAVSLPEDTVTNEYGTSKAELVDSFKEGTEAALSRANVVRTTKFETLQAFIMYLIPLCRTEISRAHSALTAMAIRLAECMGLHRDGTHYAMHPVETHVRRLVWYQLCFLDIRVCEASGPRPQIREDDFDTKFPLDVDDADFESETPPKQDSDRFTDMTIARMRFECNEMSRLVWFERPRIEKKQTSLTAVLAKIQNFRNAMEKRYLPLLNNKNPVHSQWQLVYNILSLKLIITVLHRYSSNVNRFMPERLRHMVLSSGTLMLESAIALEQSPLLKPWSWYSGSYQQWHTALLLLSELYAKDPNPSYEERVWRCLDYAFDLPPTISILEKARYVLSGIRDRTLVYQSMRKMRAPMTMEQPAAGGGPRPLATDSSPRIWYPNLARSARARMTPSPGDVSGTNSTATTPPAPATPMLGQPQLTPTTGGVYPAAAAYARQNFQAARDAYVASSAPPPHLHGAMASYHSSPDSSVGVPRGGEFGVVSGGGSSPGDDTMLDIDWNEWDRLFPQNMGAAGDMYIPDFNFPSVEDMTSWGQQMGQQQQQQQQMGQQQQQQQQQQLPPHQQHQRQRLHPHPQQ